MANHRVGGEVDAACTKCKMTLGHTILAMVGTKIARVRCNTCQGEHAYRAQASTAAPRKRAASATRESKVVISFQDRIAQKDPATAVDYSPKTTYALEQLIRHPTFGLGIVSAVRLDKIEVAFKADEKTLVHGRGGGDNVKPAYQPPNARSASPADKPMAEGVGEEAAKSPQSPSPPAGE